MTGFELKLPKRIHLIAVGGAVMHNLAIALKDMGHHVTGSDDAFHDPSKSRLEKAGFVTKAGWDEGRITEDIDLVILGMHARKDNPELGKAMQLGVPVVSFPEFIGMVSIDKVRVAIAGSHGKTTTTSMIMHALRKSGIAHDYLVGAQLEGYQTMVGISDAPVIVIESDEYLSSCLDPRPKMLHYQPHIAVITGLEWDHMNVFPTLLSYENAFRDFISSVSDGAKIFYDTQDKSLSKLIADLHSGNCMGYEPYTARYEDGHSVITSGSEEYIVKIFGRHNFANLKAASLVARELGISEGKFLEAMEDFKGAQKRMQFVHTADDRIIIQDFAHAPSKVRSTVQAVRERFPDHRLKAVLELHTFSSLNPEFLPQYEGAMNQADDRIILYAPGSSDHKRLPRLTEGEIRKAFNDPELGIVHSREELVSAINQPAEDKEVILLMSSGYWGEGPFDDFIQSLTDR